MLQTVAEVALWLGFAAATPLVVVATLFLAITQGRWALAYLFAALAIAVGWFALAVVLIRRTDPSGETVLLAMAAAIAFQHALVHHLAQRRVREDRVDRVLFVSLELPRHHT